MSLLSRQQSFLQVKRICRDSSFVTLMSFSAKLSSQIFLSLFRIPRQNSQLFLQPFTNCEALRHVISVESWPAESWPSNHVWKSGCIHGNEISCNIYFISCFLFARVRNDFRFFFCPRGTGSSFEKFEFARYLPPVNGSLRERRGFDRSSCETGTNMSRVWQKILFPRFAKCLGHR